MDTLFKPLTNTRIALIILLFILLKTHDAAHIDTIYAFRDSYTDTGNTQSETGPSVFMFVSNPPYGSTYFHRPTNRYSDGRLVIDFVANALSLPFLPPYLHRTERATPPGLNFAMAGSTAIPHDFFVQNNLTLDITPQSIGIELAWFDSFLEEKECVDLCRTPKACKRVFENALIWVGAIGINDYAYTFGSIVAPDTVKRRAINSVTAFLEAILRKGARRVVVQGLPPAGCLTLTLYLSPPDDRDSIGCVASFNRLIRAHNTALKSKLAAVRKQFPNAIVAYADYYNAYLDIVRNPSEHGLTELYKACCGYGGGAYNFDYFHVCGSPSSGGPCGDPSTYVNWDGIHLTEAMYRALADAFVNGSYCRPPFKSLFR